MERPYFRAVVQVRPFELILACAIAIQPPTQPLLSPRVRVALNTDANTTASNTFAYISTVSCNIESSISMQRGRETDLEWIYGMCFRVLWKA